MAFMPGDSKRAVPKFVDVGWVVPTIESDIWFKNRESLPYSVRYSPKGVEESKRVAENQPRYVKRIDLTSITTPELVAQLRTDSQNTQLKLVITFNNDDVDITAMAYKWR